MRFMVSCSVALFGTLGWMSQSAASSIHEIRAAKPFEFPERAPGLFAGTYFVDGESVRALTPEQAKQNYCQLIGTRLPQISTDQTFAVLQEASTLEMPYRSVQINGHLRYQFNLKAIDEKPEKPAILDIEITAAEAHPATLPATIRKCLGSYFSIR